MTENEKKQNGLMEVVFILDRSGSMSGLEADTIGGFNSMLKRQKEEGGRVIWSTVLFDTDQKVIHNRVPVEQVEPLTEREYYAGGCTALLDAVGRAITHIGYAHKFAEAGRVPEKTLFVITTDGMENASREYSYSRVSEMIRHETEKYGWEFLFLGANIDAADVGSRMGIREDRSFNFHNDREGIRKNYHAVGGLMSAMVRDKAAPYEAMEEVREDYRKRKKK